MLTTALAYAMQVLNILPGLMAAGHSVVELVTETNTALAKMQEEKRDPSPEEWDALNAKIEVLRGQLHQ